LEEESNHIKILDALKIAQCLKEDVESFKENLWLIELLTTEVMVKKPVYWKEVFQKCDINPVEPNDDMSLKVKNYKFKDVNRLGNV
jgi:hypothetical protein